MKIKELLKDLIETQKQINENIKKLNETKIKEDSRLSTAFCTIDRLENSITTNIYTKEQTIEAINMEIDYKEKLEKIQKECPELLELIEDISKNYANMDKYGILDTAIMFSNHYRVAKI